MKKLISLTMILSLFICSLCFAQAQEFAAPGVDGPILTNEANPELTTNQQTNNNTETADISEKEARLAELRLRLAQLRGEIPVEETKAATTPVIANNIQSGYTAKGVGYGFARLAQNLSVKRGQTDFVSATYIKENRYEVINKSADAWANGTFIVDIFGTNESGLKDGYQIWFALYDANLNRIGTAQAFHK